MVNDKIPITNKHLFDYCEVGNGDVEIFAAVGMGMRCENITTNHFHRNGFLTEGIVLTWNGDPYNIRDIGKSYWRYK